VGHHQLKGKSLLFSMALIMFLTNRSRCLSLAWKRSGLRDIAHASGRTLRLSIGTKRLSSIRLRLSNIPQHLIMPPWLKALQIMDMLFPSKRISWRSCSFWFLKQKSIARHSTYSHRAPSWHRPCISICISFGVLASCFLPFCFHSCCMPVLAGSCSFKDTHPPLAFSFHSLTICHTSGPFLLSYLHLDCLVVLSRYPLPLAF
jgi:hypothetical protein